MKPAVMKSAPAGNKALSVQTVTRLDNKLPTLGKLLKEGGYSTGHFGKWHLGPEPYSPLQHGFDIDIPHWHGPGPAGGFVAPWKYKQLKPNKPDEHIEDRMAEEAVKWLRSVEGTQPFFMNYWQFSVHAPFDAKKELIEHYRTKLEKLDNKDGQQSPTYAAMVHSLDDAVGTLLDAIDKAGLADETVIVFFSDNGGNMYAKVDDTYPTSNRPLRGGKATIFEGGIRGPCIIAWPGVTEPGSRCDEPIQASDFYPTFQKQLGLPVKESHIVDGIDIMPALRGEKLNREAIFTYFPFAPARVPDWTPDSVAVHAGDWKLIRFFCQGENGNHDYQLYNLADDIGEKNDLAKVSPSKVSELDKLIEDYLNRSNAVVPVPNPAFDPSQYKPELIGVPAGRNSMQKPTKQSSKRKKKANTK
jgi:arylsulfatase A-like enzyme